MAACKEGSFVILDLETTGFEKPDNPAEIVEISLVAVKKSSFIGTTFNPRLYEKWRTPVKPRKKIGEDATKAHGFTNEDLEHCEEFNEQMAMKIKTLVEMQSMPVCLVAHNGHEFDFRILRRQMDSVGVFFEKDVYCCDSLEAFWTQAGIPPNQRRRGFKVEDLYRKHVGGKIENAHTAEGDVFALMQILLGVPSDIFELLEKQKKPFQHKRKSDEFLSSSAKRVKT